MRWRVDRPKTRYCANATTEIDMTETSAPGASTGKTALTDDIRAHFSGYAPLADKARGFVKARPWTSVAFIGVAAIALLNTLRGARE